MLQESRVRQGRSARMLASCAMQVSHQCAFVHAGFKPDIIFNLCTLRSRVQASRERPIDADPEEEAEDEVYFSDDEEEAAHRCVGAARRVHACLRCPVCKGTGDSLDASPVKRLRFVQCDTMYDLHAGRAIPLPQLCCQLT
jgi:hypothetical protein